VRFWTATLSDELEGDHERGEVSRSGRRARVSRLPADELRRSPSCVGARPSWWILRMFEEGKAALQRLGSP